MNYSQLTQGLNALNTASRQRNVFLIAARNAVLSEIGAPFVTFANGYSSTTATLQADTTRLLTALRTLSAADILTAETDLAAIVAGNAPANATTFSAQQVVGLATYGVTRTNTRILTTNTALNLRHTGITANEVTAAINNEATRRFNISRQLSNGQSTMAQGVDSSVQQSVRNLVARYSSTAYNNTAITAARTALTTIINNTPATVNVTRANVTAAADNRFIRPPTSTTAPRLNAARLTHAEQQAAARAALASPHIPTIPSQHNNRSNLPNLNIEQILSLVWTAAHDRNSVLGPDQRPLTNNATNRAAIDAAIIDRERNLVTALIEFQTEYSTSSGACAHGTYNKIVETLSLAHPDVVVLNQDMRIAVEDQADRHIRGVIMPRVFAAQSNQAALHAAFQATLPSNTQQTLINDFQATVRQALRGELTGVESLYDALRTRLCPTVFTAGQYDQARILDETIPHWLDNIYEYSGACLPQPRATATPLTPTANPPANAAAAVNANAAASTTSAASASATTTQINPTGYNAQNESRLTEFSNTALQLTTNTGYRQEVRRTNVNMVQPYRNTMALPEMPVCFPYHPIGEDEDGGNARNFDRTGGTTAINVAVRFPQGTITNLPTGVRELLIQHNININHLAVNLCMQDMPWQNDQILLRPHPFLHPNAPQNGPHESSSNVLVGVTDINSRFGALANVSNIQTHGNGGVVFSTREFPIQAVNPTTGAASALATNATHCFYSLCIEPSSGRAALTLHCLLNDNDHNELLRNVIPGSRTIEELINNIAGNENLQNSALNHSPQNEISPMQAIYYLANGHQPVAPTRTGRYRVAEQAQLVAANSAAVASATTGTGATNTGLAAATAAINQVVQQQQAAQIATQAAQIAALQAQIAALTSQNTQLTQAMAGITAAYNQAEARAAAANAMVTQLQTANSQLQTSLAGTNAAYQQAEARCADAERRAAVK